jgi:UDP-glucose 4-epimerase
MLLNYTPKKRYLVTGGCGFIGSHLTDALIEAGNSVVILDNLSTGKIENTHPQASLIIGDTTDYDAVEDAFINIDGCFHLAAIASVEKSVLDWSATHTVNSTSTVNVFQAASRQDRKVPVVYTSSAAVYGDCNTTPIMEEAATCPLTAYGVDKLSCDLNGSVAWNVHGVANVGLRPFNVYGPRQDPTSPYSGVISIFADRIQRGQPITIFGDGHQVRDFVYVDDAVRTFIAAMKHLEVYPAAAGHEVYNLCTGRSNTINAVANTIASITGNLIQKNYAPARKGDIRTSVGDPSKILMQLGLQLDITLQDGLYRMLSDFNGFMLPQRHMQMRFN